MDNQLILSYIEAYGYMIIFLFLFFGIVGIPAPEESLLILVGVLIAHQQLTLQSSILVAFLGALTGMVIAYWAGSLLGNPFIEKFGRFVGLTIERRDKAMITFRTYANKTIIFGFYLPGVRQISPYIAGITKIPFYTFIAFSIIGVLLWVIPFILIGYFFGNMINPSYVPLLGILFLLVFFLVVLWKKIRGIKLKQQNDSQ